MEVFNKTERFNEDSFKELLYLYNVWFVVVITSSLASFGILNNVINMAVFFRQGLTERVNFTLFCLALSDLLTSLCALGYTTSYIEKLWPRDDRLEDNTLIVIFSWVRCFFADTSSTLTLFISIERCLCVTLPFTFSTSFDSKKTKLVVFFIACFMTVNYVPFLGTMKLEYELLPETNRTELTFIITDLFLFMCVYNNFVFGLSLAIICQVVIFVCAVLMYYGLRKSSKFRESVKDVKSDKKGNGLSNKEKRIVKMVMMLACLYLPTGLPQVGYVLASTFVPEVLSDVEKGTFFISTSAILFLVTANGSLTFFIYYNFNSSFRATFLRGFTRQSLLGVDKK
ncbi:uncharacterized protein LOC131946348 [Physella acuta]|uniref:uncharacterized protein LOC131946348 n=1 Tax=Physella acuta TaxID=109671 RepID=UPI0027DE5726|nr:uncharacterized protein LOC131946348 [Physella acuta]